MHTVLLLGTAAGFTHSVFDSIQHTGLRAHFICIALAKHEPGDSMYACSIPRLAIQRWGTRNLQQAGELSILGKPLTTKSGKGKTYGSLIAMSLDIEAERHRTPKKPRTQVWHDADGVEQLRTLTDEKGLEVYNTTRTNIEEDAKLLGCQLRTHHG